MPAHEYRGLAYGPALVPAGGNTSLVLYPKRRMSVGCML